MKDTTDQTTTGILIVDNDPLILSTFTRLLTPCGYVIKTLTDPRQTLSLLDDASIHLVITDIVMPHVDGLELCQLIKEKRPDIEVIVVTGAGSIEVAVQAMKAGAYDFLTKPLESVDRIRAQIAKAIEHSKLSSRNQYLEREVGIARRFNTIVGNSTLMHKVFQLIEAVAPTNSSVLIIGETGTGKELVARAIHEKSKRRERIFLPLNCAALTENLLEAELFGHTKGAFTGAISNRKGLIEEANGGTLFLDELGEMPLSTQAKLLRVLEQGEYKPVGSNEIRKVDVRLVCATNRDLKKAVSEGTFREDLFYRINVMAIPLPALRERKEDIPGLAQHFLALAAERVGKKITGIDPAAMTALVAWSWPGNVREVLHIIERACVVTQTSTITCTDLPDELTGSMQSLGCYNTASIFGIPYNDAKELAISTFERLYLNDLLAKTKGSIAEAARIAGIDRSNFRRLLQRYEIDADSHRI